MSYWYGTGYCTSRGRGTSTVFVCNAILGTWYYSTTCDVWRICISGHSTALMYHKVVLRMAVRWQRATANIDISNCHDRTIREEEATEFSI
jgi:hypothetical protein